MATGNECEAACSSSFASKTIVYLRSNFSNNPDPNEINPNNANNGCGEAVAGNFCSGAGSGVGSGSACATCSGSIEPVTRTATVLVSEPPQTLVAVSLKVLVSSTGPGLV